jgi:hypothetical protein
MRSSRNFPATSRTDWRRCQISHPRLCLWPSLLHADRLALMGGPKANPWEASVDTPRLPPFRQDCVRRNRDHRLQRGQGADVSRRPVPVVNRESPPSHASDVGTRRRKFQDQSGPQEMNLWTKVGSLKIFIGPKVVDTGQGIASCPYAAALTWRMQLWGETAMKWSQAICASILVDEFYLLSLNARSNPRSGRDVPRLPAEPAFRPNLFTADWGLPPNPARTRPPKPQADAS